MARIRSSPTQALLAALVGTAACSSESAAPTGTGGSASIGGAGATAAGGSASTSSSGGHGGTAGASSAECAPPGHVTDAAPQTFTSLVARVVDPGGAPVSGINVQVCGLDLCVAISDTDTNGAANLSGQGNVTRPAFKYGVGRDYARFAYLIGPGADQDIGEQRTIPLPASGDPLDPGTDPSSAGVTLHLPLNMGDIQPDPFDFDTDALRSFRAAEVPIGQAPDAVDPSLGLERIIALSPVGTELCPAPAMTIDNALGWAPDTAVEIYLHGVEVAEDWAPYGGWAMVATARVTSDGASIETDDGQGLPILSVIGLRRAP